MSLAEIDNVNVNVDVDSLRDENRRLREQLEAKSRVATRALATYQQRVMQMEEHSAALAAANEEIQSMNAKLSEAFRVLAEKDRRMTEDLHQARTFQQRMLPKMPTSAAFDFAVAYRPAELVGGDIYDVWELRPDCFRIFVADAAGHGVQAALRTMILKSEYDRIKIVATTPEEALIALNTRIALIYPGLELHCTAACLDLTAKPAGGAHVLYATAAHPPLLHFGSHGSRQIYQPGSFLGVVSEVALESVEFTLAEGDRLIVYTDGLSEQWASSGEEFGIERVEHTIASRSGPIQDTVDALLRELDDFLDHRELADDAAVIAIECRASVS